MRYFIVIIFFLIFVGFVSAQQATPYPDLVFLNNGSMLKCKILGYEEGGDVKLQIQGGSMLVYKLSDIKEIIRDADNKGISPAIDKVDAGRWLEPTKEKKDFHAYHKGNFYFALNIDVTSGFKEIPIWGGGSLDVPSLGVGANFSMGIALSPRVMVGAGVAWVYLDNYFSYSNHVPVFAEIRGDIIRKPTSLYYSLKAGYNIAIMRTSPSMLGFLMREAQNGIYIKPALGISFASREKAHFTIEFGYSIHTASYSFVGFNNDLVGPTKNTFLRPCLSVGMLF